MTIAAILIAVSPPAPAPPLARTLAESCSAAARPLRCEILEEGSTRVPTATVRWDSPTHARVDARAKAATRSVEFRPEDPEGDRWQALGLVVASLLEGPDARPLEEAVARPPRPGRRAILWMNGGAAVGQGLEPRSPRVEGWLGGGYRLHPVPIYVGVGAGVGVASGPADLTATWTTFSAQVGMDFIARPLDLGLRPHLGLLSERIVAEVSRGPTTGTSGSRWLDGAALGAEVVWPVRSVLSLVVGADASWLSGATAVRLDDRKIASFPALGYRAFLGVQVTLVPEHPSPGEE